MTEIDEFEHHVLRIVFLMDAQEAPNCGATVVIGVISAAGVIVHRARSRQCMHCSSHTHTPVVLSYVRVLSLVDVLKCACCCG